MIAEPPEDSVQTTPHGDVFDRLVKEKKLEIVYIRPLDLSIDETLTASREAVVRTGAKRADVPGRFPRVALPHGRRAHRDGRHGHFHRRAAGFVHLPPVQSARHRVLVRRHHHAARYVESGGQLERAITVVKVRGSNHSKDLCEYEITSEAALVVGEPLRAYEGLLTGATTHWERRNGSTVLRPGAR